MIGNLLCAIRKRYGFSKDMMASALCMKLERYSQLEDDMAAATFDELTLVESVRENLFVTL